VLASSCADAMQKGAAYFGRAGFDVVNVINTMSETSGGPTSTTGPSNLNIYMNSLIGKVTESSLSDLNRSKTAYSAVLSDSGSYKDAQFSIGIVDTVKSLSILKTVFDSTGTGAIAATCDRNANNKPDTIDSSSCAFLISSGATITSCASNMTLTVDVPNMIITNLSTTVTGTYRGLIFQVDGAGTNVAGCRSPNQYKQLLYWSTAASAWAPVAVIAGTDSCVGNPGGATWPCPIIQNNGPLDLVSAIDSSLNNAVSSLNAALSSGTTTTSDVQTAVQNLLDQACPSGTCTSTDIANYLQTY
jgi:hypothetical protein